MPVVKILLVDDEDALAVVLQRALTLAGYEVLRASNGRAALQLYDAPTIGLVITDLIMPDMEGVELILALRRLNPTVKIIAMSGGGRNQPGAYLGLAQRLGAMKTLTKPFPIATLVETVQECLATP